MKSSKIKIFVSAYACEPNLGSEIGGMELGIEMSKYFELWVLTRKSNQNTIEVWLEENSSYKSINFIYLDLPYYLRFWKKRSSRCSNILQYLAMLYQQNC